MEKHFGQYVKDHTPQMNHKILTGLAHHHMKLSEKYIDDVWKSIAKEFPAGLVYEGYTRSTYQEEYNEETRKKNSRSAYDIARHDFYMVQYDFSLNGEKMEPLRIQLPFVTRRNTIYIGASRWLVAPVLSDPVISVTLLTIFVRLLRARLIFHSTDYRIKINDVIETCQVVWSRIHNRSGKGGKSAQSVSIEPSLVHYLFGKYGFTETFAMYGKTRPHIGTADTINEASHPVDQWVICSSIGRVMPRNTRDPYPILPLRIAIKREEWTPMTLSLVAGFYYILDQFPERHASLSLEDLDNIITWRSMLGVIIWPDTDHHGKLINECENHYESLDHYIDNLINDKFKDMGLHFNNFYDFLACMVENYRAWYLEGETKINSMYGKELSIVYYMFYKLTKEMFMLNFALKKLAAKDLNKKKLEDLMKDKLVVKILRGLYKNCGCLVTEQTPGDNPAFKLHSILIPQSKAIKEENTGNEKSNNDPSRRLHVSIAEIGGYMNLPKSEASGRERLNPFALFDHKNRVMRHEAFRPLLDETEAQIRRR